MRCPRCDHDNPRRASHCEVCGTALAAAPAPAAPALSPGHRQTSFEPAPVLPPLGPGGAAGTAPMGPPGAGTVPLGPAFGAPAAGSPAHPAAPPPAFGAPPGGAPPARSPGLPAAPAFTAPATGAPPAPGGYTPAPPGAGALPPPVPSSYGESLPGAGAYAPAGQRPPYQPPTHQPPAPRRTVAEPSPVLPPPGHGPAAATPGPPPVGVGPSPLGPPVPPPWVSSTLSSAGRDEARGAPGREAPPAARPVAGSGPRLEATRLAQGPELGALPLRGALFEYQGLGHPGFIHTLRAGRNVIGRDASVCDVVIEHERVSKQHAFLFIRGDEVSLLDISANGTLVDGRTVHGAEAHLGAPAVIEIGASRLVFVLVPRQMVDGLP